jgi:hypothetical protein
MPANTHYYSKLSYSNQKVYRLVSSSLYSRKERVSVVGRYASDDLFTIARYVLLDDPKLFFVDSKRIQLYQSGKTNDLIFSFLYSPVIASDMMQKVDVKVKAILNAVIQDDISREKYIYTHLANNTNYNNRGASNQNADNHMIGPLLNGLAVCEGYAKAFKHLCDAASLHCIVVTGTAISPNGGEEPHAWNIVMVNDSYYHVDVTWDSILKDTNIYDYFNLSDIEIEKDHKWDKDVLPSCNRIFEIIHRIQNNTELENYIVSQLSKGAITLSAILDYDCKDERELSIRVKSILDRTLPRISRSISSFEVRFNKQQSKAVISFSK